MRLRFRPLRTLMLSLSDDTGLRRAVYGLALVVPLLIIVAVVIVQRDIFGQAVIPENYAILIILVWPFTCIGIASLIADTHRLSFRRVANFGVAALILAALGSLPVVAMRISPSEAPAAFTIIVLAILIAAAVLSQDR